ncbi:MULTISPECIES: transporter [Oxalobacteraceae]|jgi:hypothetical protein|uniref:transporter n=1 Tax=Oxalobacteraceae TaxID=75682 RepID=UPI001B3BED3B|nr:MULTISPECIES: transporter [Oxalobacteraceae]
MKTPKLLLLAAAVSAIPSLSFASCGAAFCTVNSNWTSESAMVDATSSFDLRYEFIKQDQPRTGTDNIAVGQIPHHHDEVSTYNRNLVASYSRSFGSGWGVSVIAPMVDRDHTHIHNHRGVQVVEQWNFSELGDMRVIGRYQLPMIGDPINASTAGFTFGLKLPTGRTDVANADGDVAERSLQPGSGTTDLIAGAYYHQKLPLSNSSWFAQVQYQHALNEHDGFKPGAQFGADLGYRYGVSDNLGALVQLNAVVKHRDSGTDAEPADSGSRSVFISPGLSYAVASNLQLYGFYQHPIYQNVNGVQLTAKRAFVLGLSGRF